MQRVCVYTGSNIGKRQEYKQAAQDLARELVARKLGLVYGGGRVGLMGVIADAVMAEGGEVIGVMPRALFPAEVANIQVTTLYEVGSMHERKALMADLADGFIALPGGFGTYDELFEIITWGQLGLHQKPVGLLNAAEYFAPLLALITHSVNEGFVAPYHAQRLLCKETPQELLDEMEKFIPAASQSKWNELPDR